MPIRQREVEFVLKCKGYEILEDGSPYMSLVTCRPADMDDVLLVINQGNVEKLDRALLEQIMAPERATINRAIEKPEG